MSNYVKPVVFKVGKEEYGVDISIVQSIEKNISVVPVPESVSYIKGIVNLRGNVIPVYSLKKKFGIKQDNKAENVIIVNTGDVELGLEVDEVLEIRDFDESHITDMPSIVKNEKTDFMDKVINFNGTLIVCLDIKKLLNDEEKDAVRKIVEDINE